MCIYKSLGRPGYEANIVVQWNCEITKDEGEGGTSGLRRGDRCLHSVVYEVDA